MQVLNLGIPLLSILLMVAVGMELESSDFRKLLHRKSLLSGTLLLPVLILPLLAFFIAKALELPPHLAAGILLLAACPVGDIANVYTLLARGNLAMCVAVNTLSCLFSAVTMAFIFFLYSRLLHQQFVFALPPSTLFLRLTLMVALPVMAGMAVRRWQAPWVAAHRRTLHNFCLVGIGFLVVYIMVNRWSQVAAEWPRAALASLAFMVAALAVGLLVARLLSLSTDDGITVGIVFTARNVALAMVIAVTILGRLDFAEVAVIYFLVEVPLLLAAISAYRYWIAKTPQTMQADGAGT